MRYNVKFIETDRVTSATEVRNAIRSDDKQKFKELVPKELWGEYEKMRELMKEAFEIDFDIMMFEEWIEANQE